MVVARDVDLILMRAVVAGVVPGVVAMAAGDDGVLYAGAFGTRQVGQNREMSLDTVVELASMTKAVTSVVAMQLV
jgi:CubicO group peptidase (beta-lactamase class C family)